MSIGSRGENDVDLAVVARVRRPARTTAQRRSSLNSSPCMVGHGRRRGSATSTGCRLGPTAGLDPGDTRRPGSRPTVGIRTRSLEIGGGLIRAIMIDKTILI
jgi:hypothetical protein